VEQENAFFKSSPVDEYHLPQMNSDFYFVLCLYATDFGRISSNLAGFGCAPKRVEFDLFGKKSANFGGSSAKNCGRA
jgi:hypothetical protein